MASPKKSPKKTRARKDTTLKEILKPDQVFLIYLALVVVVVIVSYLYTRKGDNWWANVRHHTPSWGQSEALILVLFLFFYLAVTFSSLALARHISDQQERSVVHLTFVLISILLFAYFYASADGNEHHEEGFYVVLSALLLGLVLVYLAYRNWHIHSLWSSGFAIAVGIYLTIWTWKVYDNETA